jgi:uncharacterized protein (TIGR02996 family)
MATLVGLLTGIVQEPQAEDRWLVLADWLEEHDDPRRAELLRLHRKLLATCCAPEEHPERSSWQARIVALLAAGVKPCVPQKTVVLAPGVEMTFSFIPPGGFFMGSPKGEGLRDGETPHLVTLTRGFWLGVTQVTQAHWVTVMGNNPSQFQGKDRPVELVSWDDCQAFCRKVGRKTRKPFRLPESVEWEYACRAGTATPFFVGQTLSMNSANYNGNVSYHVRQEGIYRGQTTPVGDFPPNGWGLYDMHGNVWEWCRTCYRGHRILRGGAWVSGPELCRSAFLMSSDIRLGMNQVGCRVVLCLD